MERQLFVRFGLSMWVCYESSISPTPILGEMVGQLAGGPSWAGVGEILDS